jgi:GNAT superfamily N-acetyltransferase
MDVRTAGPEDASAYVALAQAAQAWLQSRGLGQYIPAAHDEYAAMIRSRIESGTLFAVWEMGEAVAFFNLDPAPSLWWPADDAPALYLAGMVVARSARGRGVGKFIIRWCAAEAVRDGRRAVRLDCHAGNPWLCGYYESQWFELRGRLEQHPGYHGCLYQLEVPPGEDNSDTEVRFAH